MTRRAGLLVAALATLATVSGLSAAEDARQSKIVARAGDAALTVGAVERRLKALSPAEIAALGGPPAEAPRRLVEQVLAGELSAELAARARGLDRSPSVADKTREILRLALDQALRTQTLHERPVTDQEIADYYQLNRPRFEQPARVRVWRILVDDAALAQRILDEAKKAGEPTKWSELARQHSIDKATNMRQGDLGFVRPDGSTDVPRVMVDSALFKAADAVNDGEFVPHPVPEAGKFAVVWRRGSLPKKSRTVAEESDSIRQLLERRRVDEARKNLIATLRRDAVKDEKVELLETIPEGLLSDGKARLPRSAPPARHPDTSDIPSPTERGLR